MPVYRRAARPPEIAQDIDSRALARAQKDNERHGTLYYVLLGLMASGRETALNIVARAGEDIQGRHEDGQTEPGRSAGRR
ncbi:MAG: hypothetical protein IT323_10810 [Anaerolineae bacterium]|nr:hypothetical protein [Anaerolineae bacterium]